MTIDDLHKKATKGMEKFENRKTHFLFANRQAIFYVFFEKIKKHIRVLRTDLLFCLLKYLEYDSS